MLETIPYKTASAEMFTIFYDDFDSHYIRAAIYKGRLLLSIVDVARCMGLKAPSKFAQRFTCEKIKLETKGLGDRVTGMWYFNLDDAYDFVDKHYPFAGDFKKWFCGSFVPELRKRDICSEHKKVESEVRLDAPRSPAEKPEIGVNSICARIDQMIIELLTLKQELT